jgi:peptide/nickel transport system substrate-binding protein
MVRRNTRFYSALAALLFLVGCHWSEPPPQDTIVFALSSEPKTLDPRYATDASGQRLGRLIFSSLIQWDPRLNFVGVLAESWDYQDLTYRFQLKPGIQFHNGDFATAEDFLFSVDQYRDSRSPFAPNFSVIEDVQVTYNAETGGVLKLRLKDYSAPFVQDLPTLKLLSKRVVEAAGEDFYANPVGTGPYRFVKKDIKNVHLERFANYVGEPAKTKNLQFKIIKDSNTRFQKMYKGKIDIIQSDVPFSKVRFFAKEKDFNVVVAPGLSTNYVLLNLRHPFLSQKKVRQAISSAIDRKQLIQYTLEGFAEEATSIVTKINPFHHHGLQYQHLVPKKIKSIFADYQGDPIILKTSNTQEAVAKGRVITHQLQALGLPVEQQTYEWGTYYEDVRTGKFDMAIMKWVGINDPDIYRVSLHSAMTPPGRNRGYYNNPEFDKVVEQAFREADFAKRQALYKKAQEIAFADLPTIPLWYEQQVAIVHRRVRDYELPVNGDFSSLLKVYKDDVKRR